MLSSPKNGDIGGLDARPDRSHEGLALELPEAEIAIAALLVKLPSVKAAARVPAVAEEAHLAAEPVKPELAFIIEEIGRVLAPVDLRHIFFAQAKLVEANPAAIEVTEHVYRLFVVDFEVNAPVSPGAAERDPHPAARFVLVAPVDRKIDIAEIVRN